MIKVRYLASIGISTNMKVIKNRVDAEGLWIVTLKNCRIFCFENAPI